MPNLVRTPLTIVAKVVFGTISVQAYYDNPSSFWNGHGYRYTVGLEIIPQFTSDYESGDMVQYDGRDLTAGMWVGFPGGTTFRIANVNTVNYNGTQVNVTIEDKDLLKLISRDRVKKGKI